jgi:hypothetical protein
MKYTQIVALATTVVVAHLACSDVGRHLITDDLIFLDNSEADASSTDLLLDSKTKDTDPSLCEFSGDGTLKGVSFDLSGNDCVFTLDEIAAGISLHYRIVVEEELHNVVSRPLDAGQCDELGPAGLRTFEKIHGNDQTYCICDSGLCGGPQESVDLVPGDYSDSFDWDGRNWNGPSDTGNPMGAPFPPGEYVLVVRSEGTHGTLQSDFAVTATMKIHLQQ